MKIKIEIMADDREQAIAIKRALADEDFRTLAIIVGTLRQLPQDQRQQVLADVARRFDLQLDKSH